MPAAAKQFQKALKSAQPTLDDDGKSFTVYGVRYQIELFRMMAQCPISARWIFQRREDGHMEVTMETPYVAS